MHGQVLAKEQHGSFYICGPVQIEQVLTQEQKKQVEDLSSKQEREMRKLLKSFVE